MVEVSEVSLRDFIESVWFKGLARGAMIVSTVILTIGSLVFSWAIGETRKDVATVTSLAAETASALAVTDANVDAIAAGNEAFQVEMREGIRGLTRRADRVTTDLGEVKGIISQMNRRDLAAPFSTGAVPGGR